MDAPGAWIGLAVIKPETALVRAHAELPAVAKNLTSFFIESRNGFVTSEYVLPPSGLMKVWQNATV